MAVKKSSLYSKLWDSCNTLRSKGGMDATQYKDYVKSVNVNLEFGNERDYVSSEFTLD